MAEQEEYNVDGATLRRTTLLATSGSGIVGTALATAIWGGGGLLCGLLASGVTVAVEMHANPEEYVVLARHLGPAARWVARGLRHRRAKRFPRPHDRLAELRALPYPDYLQTPEWQAKRTVILERDKYTCQDCSATERLEVHHLTYERLGCEQDGDLLTLCRDCHQKRHDEAGEAAQPVAAGPALPKRSPAFRDMRHLLRPDIDVLGFDGQQFITAASFKQAVNIALIGVPGAGKTVCLSFHVAQAILRRAIIRGWDLHGDVAADLGDMFHILEEVDEIVADCQWIARERERRMRLRKQAKAGERGAQRAWEATRELVYIIDEFNALMLRLKRRKAERDLVADTLLSLIAEGRKFKMRVILAGQTMPASLFGDQGSSARDIINTKYAFQSRENHAQYFGVEQEAISALLPLIAGKESAGYAILDGGGLLHARIVSIPMLTVDDIRALVMELGIDEMEDEDEKDEPEPVASEPSRRYGLSSAYTAHQERKHALHTFSQQARAAKVEAQAEPTKTELERAQEAYANGATTIDKLSAALGVSHWSARQLISQIRAQ